MNCDSEFAAYFEQTYSKSIAISHREYLMERCSDRSLLIYGIGEVAVNLKRYLALNGIHTDALIDDNLCGQKIEELDVISLIDLVYMENGKYFVILARDDENYGLSRQKFLDMGLREDVDFTYFTEIPGTNELFHYDVTLSFSRIRQTYQGFEVFGNESDADAIRIVALGGSTTECSLFYVKGWVRFLVDYLKEQGISAVVYGGGVSSYTSSQELLKLIRDVIPLNPDIVISYSGVNDLYSFPKPEDGERYRRPFITRFQMQFIQQILERLTKEVGIPVVNAPSWNQLGHSTVFYGLKNNKTAAELWIDNERMMNALCEAFEIHFFGFFQPFRFNGSYQCTPLQEIIHSRRDLTCVPTADGEKRWGESVKKDRDTIISEITKYSFLSDFSNIFDGQSEVFYDTTHVYENGNMVIARGIFNKILPCIHSLQSTKKRHSIDLHIEEPSCLPKLKCNSNIEEKANAINYYDVSDVCPMAEIKGLKCGDRIEFGGYTWVVLYINTIFALVLSENILARMDYHHTLTSITWEESQIRHWLNTEFYCRFPEAERKAILPAFTMNHNNPHFDTEGGNTTVDKVFLLSYEDIEKFFKDISFKSTEIAQETCWWWLRTPGIYSDRVAAVHEDGHVVMPGYYIKSSLCNNTGGIRPALLLSVNDFSLL